LNFDKKDPEKHPLTNRKLAGRIKLKNQAYWTNQLKYLEMLKRLQWKRKEIRKLLLVDEAIWSKYSLLSKMLKYHSFFDHYQLKRIPY
jgi:hypothetical protein